MDNYQQHPNGKIWVMWKDRSIKMKVMKCSDQFIHCEMYTIHGMKKHWLTIIYAHNQLVNRKKLWLDIKNYANTVKGHWMVIRDSNNVLNMVDRIGGSHVHEIEYSDMECMMEEIDLNEHDTMGSHFTW